MQDAAAALYPEQEENTRNENGDETTEIIFEDQQAELEIEEHNPIATDMDLHSDEQPVAESPGDHNSSIHQTVISENDCQMGPPSKARRIEIPPKKERRFSQRLQRP